MKHFLFHKLDQEQKEQKGVGVVVGVGVRNLLDN